MTTYPLPPFPRKGVTTVQALRAFRKDGFAPPWDGPAEARGE
jgi:hypothetical protein